MTILIEINRELQNNFVFTVKMAYKKCGFENLMPLAWYFFLVT